MLQTLLMHAVRSPRGALILASSAGVLIGCCVCGFYLSGSSLSYATILSLGLVAPLAVYVFPDNRKALWFFLCLSMPISIDVALNEVDHLGGTPGLMISTIDMALFALYADLDCGRRTRQTGSTSEPGRQNQPAGSGPDRGIVAVHPSGALSGAFRL